jgi:hypothetical protein
MNSKRRQFFFALNVLLVFTLFFSSIFPHGGVDAAKGIDAINIVTPPIEEKGKAGIQRPVPPSFPKIDKVPTEIQGKRTALKKEFLNPDGSITALIALQSGASV